MKIQTHKSSNCVFGVLYLLIRGKLTRLHLISSVHKLLMHVVGETRRGHVIHFYPSDENCNPLWFVGRFEGINKTDALGILESHDRKLLSSFPVGSNLNFYLFIVAMGILLVPWLVFWIAYFIGWVIYWSIMGLKRKRIST